MFGSLALTHEVGFLGEREKGRRRKGKRKKREKIPVVSDISKQKFREKLPGQVGRFQYERINLDNKPCGIFL